VTFRGWLQRHGLAIKLRPDVDGGWEAGIKGATFYHQDAGGRRSVHAFGLGMEPTAAVADLLREIARMVPQIAVLAGESEGSTRGEAEVPAWFDEEGSAR